MFENFVELFVDLAQKKHTEICRERETITRTLQAIDKGTVLADQLKKELNREHLVLEQKNYGNSNLLRQIGQDKAITEEQVRLVQKQQLKIERLKRLLPKYQDAHERAVFKAAAMVKEIKQVLSDLGQQGLSDLRSMQKPDAEIEDVLAAIIIIVKSPVSDLTWNKGAKRIMANLERFREELSAFDEVELTSETLQVVEPYTKRPHFTPGYMDRKLANNALESLVLWVRGVVRYHRMMQSRVKPLHGKVEQTSAQLDEAVEKLGGMESKLKDLGDRMSNLSNKYEDASVDKSKQVALTEDQHLQLERATRFEQILSKGRQTWKKVLSSISRREMTMAGSVTLAAAFASYMGPYEYAFRRDMVTQSWIRCLEERGIQLNVQLTDDVSVDITANVGEYENDEIADDTTDVLKINQETLESQDTITDSSQGDETTGERAGGNIGEDASVDPPAVVDPAADITTKISESSTKGETGNYNDYCTEIIKILIGDYNTRTLITKGIDQRQLEDVAIMKASKQKPLLIIDPFDRAVKILKATKTEGTDIVLVDISERDSNLHGKVEKCVTSGSSLVLYNIYDKIDSFLFPLIDHINTSGFKESNEPSVVKLNGRRLMIHPLFHLTLVSASPTPNFSLELSSTTTLLDLRPYKDGMISFLQLRSMTRIRPDVALEMKKVYFELFHCLKALEQLDNNMMNVIKRKVGVKIWEETEFIANLVEERGKISERLNRAITNLRTFESELKRFEAISELATSIFYICMTLKNLRHEYQFSFDYFVSIFDEAVGGEDLRPSDDYIFESGYDSNKTDSKRDHDKQNKSLRRVHGLVGVRSAEFNVQLTTDYKGIVNNNCDRDSHADALPTTFEPPLETLVSVPEVPEGEQPTIEEIGLLKNNLLQIMYQNVSRSLTNEHLDSFILLVWLCISSADFRQPDYGLADVFLMKSENVSKINPPDHPNLVKPNWLPQTNWDNLLTMSSLHQPLERIIRDISANSNQWMMWYESINSEQISFPWLQNEDNSQEISVDDMANDVLRLLVVKCLRPDRFQVALTNLARQSLNNILSQTKMRFSDVLTSIDATAPVLILLPSNEVFLQNSDRETPSRQIAQLISLEAEASGKSLLTIQVFDGNENMIDVALNNAVSTDNWIFIENLHLGHSEWLRQFSKRISRLVQQPGNEQENRWRIFMTAEPCDFLPVPLLYLCQKLSWDFASSLTQNDDQKISLMKNSLKDSVVKSIGTLSQDIWTSLKDQSLTSRSLIYSLCIVHGVLVSRQLLFAPRTFTKKCTFNSEDLQQSVNWILHHVDPEDIEGTLKDILMMVSETIYGAKVSSNSDLIYLGTIFNCLVKNLTSNQESSIEIGEWTVPIPPANVNPMQYGEWFADKFETSDITDQKIKAFGILDDDTRNFMRERSSSFLDQLRILFQSFSKDTFDCLYFPLDNHHLKQTVDLCLERLPTLLKVDEDYGLPMLLSNSHLRSPTPLSEKSSVRSIDGDTPPTLGYCLLKECQIFNETLWYIWSDLTMLNTRLISGSLAAPKNLINVIQALHNGLVPYEWLHTFERPTPKNLLTWLEWFMKRRQQLNEFLDKGLVPQPTAEPITSHGILKRMILGLFVNPGAILAALRHEKAVLEGVNLYEVELKCIVFHGKIKHLQSPKVIESEPGIMLENLFLEGASWDTDKNCLSSKSTSIGSFGSVFITPIVKRIEENTRSLFNCPVFVNRYRQKLSFYLPLPCEENVEQLVLQGAAIFLNADNLFESN